MKNLKVSVKLTVSFGIILLCLVIVAIAVLITGNKASDSLQSIEALNSFQATTQTFTENFYEVRIGGNVLLLGVNESEYNRITDRYADAKTALDKLIVEASASKRLSEFTEDFREISNYTQEWMRQFIEINNTNIALDEMQSRFNGIVEKATNQTYEDIYSAQFDNLEANIREGSNVSDMLRRRERVMYSSDLILDIQLMSIAANPIIAYYDLTAEAEARASIAGVIESLDKYIEDSSQQKDKDYGIAARDTIMEYSSLFDEYVETIHKYNNMVTTIKNHVVPTIALINSTYDHIGEIVSLEIANAEQANRFSLVIAISISAFAIACGLFVTVLLIRSISKPLLPLTAVMKKASTTGDLTLTQEEQEQIENLSQAKDEIGQTIAACASFLKHVTKISGSLGVVSNGDLSSDFTVLSDKDVLGLSLKKMTESLNDMFYEISTSANQVSTGSKQIADGAQSLAQGSTEQAASIQELSNFIGEIANKTKQNAGMAEKATILADSIKTNAEKGNRQMDEMMMAVNEINEASGSISKVIKVIDEIAFQTNILALNAAVEAARAGNAGKGFAVVAEEVRSLAAKSATAARDTGAMIENSIEKAGLGVRIAGETAASLSEIVTGINESSQIVGDIAKSSDEQFDSVSQINVGIDQVAQVIQQNSATAEESAAASEEMSGQSDVLQELLSHFKLKNANSIYSSYSMEEASEDNYKKLALPYAVNATSNNSSTY